MTTPEAINKNFSLIGNALTSCRNQNVKPLSNQELRFVQSKGDFTKNFTPKEYAAFMQNLCMNIHTMMQKHREEEEKASRKLRASAEGKDYNDVE